MGLALLIILRFVVGLAFLRHYDRLSVCARVQMMLKDVFPVESELTLKKEGEWCQLGIYWVSNGSITVHLFASASGGVRGYIPER